MALGLRRVEIIVGRLLAGQIGVPRRPPARAIVEHALDRARQHARRGAAGAIAAVAGIAPVVRRSALDRPGAVLALGDLDHPHADPPPPAHPLAAHPGPGALTAP